MEQKIVWYAACDYIRWTGPFPTQLEAWEALRLTEDARVAAGTIHMPGARVWPRKEGEEP